MNNTSLIIKREYLERVNKKSFILTTLLVPVAIILLAALPTLFMLWMPTEVKRVAVVDDSGLILPQLESTDDVRFIPAFGELSEMLSSDSIYGVLIIERNILKNSKNVKLLTSNAASTAVEQTVVSQMEDILEKEKLKSYDIHDLDKILADVRTDVTLQSVRIDEVGEEGETQSAMLDSIAGMMFNFVLYMFLLLYGSMVMNSIIEEKNNRVLEIVVSSVRPFQLMMGKIVGVGLVALTQIVIWGVIIFACTSLLLPALLPAELMAEASAINAGTADPASVTLDADLAHLLGSLTDVGGMAATLGLLLVFLIGGYMLYAAIFAAIGAAVDNVQDASQLQMIGLVPIIIGLVASMAVVNDPSSTFALVMSLFPLTSPMVMMARVPFGIPGWEISLSVVLLALSVWLMIWIAGKVYRVGIFMYGKKPTVADLVRWARTK